MDRQFIMTALGYAVIGMLLGIHMAASQNHMQHVTHAHVLLLGFVVSFVYGLCHKLWLGNTTSRLARIQFWLHQAGVAVMSVGLFLLYGNFVEGPKLEPFLATSSFLVLGAVILMKVLFIRAGKAGAG